MSGNNAEQFLESIMVSDLKALQKGNGKSYFDGVYFNILDVLKFWWKEGILHEGKMLVRLDRSVLNKTN